MEGNGSGPSTAEETAAGGMEAPATGSGTAERTPRPAPRDPWKDVLLRRLVASADVAAVLLAGLVAGLTAEHGLATAIAWAALLPLWIGLGKLHGLYDEDHVRIRHLTSDELPRLFNWVTMSSTAAGLLLTLAMRVPISLHAAIAGWAVALVAVVALRFAARSLWSKLVTPERGIVVGEGPLADALARKLVLEPGHHFELVRSLVPPAAPQSANGRPHRTAGPGALPELEEAITHERADRVVLAMPDLDEPTLAGVVTTCRAHGVKLSVAPPLRAMLGTAVELTHLAELPLIEFRTWNPSRSTAFLKRAMDVTLAGAGLVALSPLLVLIAVAVKVDSRGPVLFRQWRAGQAGVPFQLLKFRTMVADAEERLDEVVSIDDLPEPRFKLRADPRVTRVGRWLRSTSLDELAQLVNVLRGQMSMVGPRPELLRLVERYPPEFRFRLEMRPGITGPMQIHGRGELTFQEWMAVEREYVENYSLRKDLKILLATPAAVLMRRGAF